MENGFHDFSDPEKGMDDLFQRFKDWRETGTVGDFESLFESLSVTLMHLGIDRNVFNITTPYCAVMSALGYNDLGQAIKKVTMRIGRSSLAVAYAVDNSVLPFNGIDDMPAPERDAMTSAIVHVLHGMGARVTRVNEVITITGWDCNDPDHDHPVTGSGGDQPVSMTIDQAVSDFRKELDRELGDSNDPIARWMAPREEDDT